MRALLPALHRLRCLNLASVFNSVNTYTITWSNGQTSAADGTFTVTSVGGTIVVIAEGTITAGQFTGATAVLIYAWPAPNPLACLTTTGVTQLTGVTTLQVTSLEPGIDRLSIRSSRDLHR